MNLDISELLDYAEDGYRIHCRGKNGSIDLFARSECMDTLLHVAASRMNFQEVKFLIEKGLDINARGDYCETPLFAAAASGQIAMVAFLLKEGADESIPDHRGNLAQQALFKKLSKSSEAYIAELVQWEVAQLAQKNSS